MADFQVVLSTSSATLGGNYTGIYGGANDAAWATIHDATSANAVAANYGAVRVNATATTDIWETISRTAARWDLTSYMPNSGHVSAASYVLPVTLIDVTPAFGAADLAASYLYITAHSPAYTQDVNAADFRISRFTTTAAFAEIPLSSLTAAVGSYITVALNQDGVDYLNSSIGSGYAALGLLWSWDYINAPPSWVSGADLVWQDYTGAASFGSYHKLSLNYSTPSAVEDVTRRRFELPVETSRFVPVRRSTRYGTPLSLQDVRAAQVELPAQLQDFMNETPPFITRNVAITPESQVTAQAGTLLIASGLSERNVWYKKYGSGNTGWIAFAMQE